MKLSQNSSEKEKIINELDPEKIWCPYLKTYFNYKYVGGRKYETRCQMFPNEIWDGPVMNGRCSFCLHLMDEV